MATSLDTENVRSSYSDVRNDNSETLWAIFKYDDKTITTASTGSDYDEFKSSFSDDDRAFGYLRVTTGDEMSKRAKFVFVTWSGHNLSPLKRAKLSTDKALLKKVIQTFAVEFTTSDQTELDEDHIKDEVRKAGGANYGTGSR